jgi:hypothetical protein
MGQGLAERFPGWTVETYPFLSWFPPEELQKRANSDRLFDRMYRNRPISSTERVFPNFPKCLDHEATVAGTIRDRENWVFVSGVDPSGKKRRGNAVLTVGLHLPTNRRIPVDCRLGAWSAAERINQISQANRIWNPGVIAWENNAMQGDAIQMLEESEEGRTFAHKVEGVYTGGGKAVELGLLDVQFANQAWVIPMGEECYDSEGVHHAIIDHCSGCSCAWCRLIADITDYTADYEGTFDLGMAFFFCAQLLDQYIGDPTAGGEVEEIIEPDADGVLYLDEMNLQTLQVG